jgi:uncharacterized protein (TIGR02058 family)
MMAKKRILIEFGMGSSLRRMDYSGAATRAIKDALWHNSINAAELFGFQKTDMIVDVTIGVQQPDAVDTDSLAATFPYGQISVQAVHGGLDVKKPNDDGTTVIANAAIEVSFDMEATQ